MNVNTRSSIIVLLEKQGDYNVNTCVSVCTQETAVRSLIEFAE